MARTTVVLMCLGIVVAACGLPWRVQYLQEATNVATQDAVTQRLGPPIAERTLATGQSVWLYQHVRAYQGTTYCTQYVLTFDQLKILREWKRQGC